MVGVTVREKGWVLLCEGEKGGCYCEGEGVGVTVKEKGWVLL